MRNAVLRHLTVTVSATSSIASIVRLLALTMLLCAEPG